MALHYNLAKVYEISDNDTEFVIDVLKLFIGEAPNEVAQMKIAINNKIIKRLTVLLIKLSLR